MREGVTHAFGGPGAASLPLLAGLAGRPPARGIGTRHDRVAGFMADGFARASGELAACVGAAGLATGLAAAYAESVPVLALVGETGGGVGRSEPAETEGGHGQAGDPVALLAPVTKWAAEVRIAERAPELIQRAAQVAVAGRPRPVVVSLPADVQVQALRDPDFRLPFSVAAPIPQPAEIERAAELLAWSMRPAIVAGGGAERAGARTTIAALADALGAPVACAWQRKAAFPNDHPAFVGMLGPGAHEAAERAVREADVVLALGCRLSIPPWNPVLEDAALIQVDVDPEELGAAYAPSAALCGDAEATARALLNGMPEESGPSEPRWERRLALRAAYEEQARPPDGAPLVHALLYAQAQHDPVFVVDAPEVSFPVKRAESWYGGDGPAGWAFGAALGAQLARPSERILCATTGESLWSVAQDLETAVRERIPVVALVAAGERDLAAFARLVGAHGERVERPEELAPAIDRALAAGRPAVVDAVLDAAAVAPTG